MTFAESMKAHATQYLTEALAQSGGNVTVAALRTGINRQDFYTKCERYGVACARNQLRPSRQPRSHINQQFQTWALPTGVRT